MSGRFNLNDYVTVDERIDRFWERYPNGAIRTEMIYTNNDGSSVAIIARVYKDWEHPASNPDATGIAQELQGGANANKSSWWENCETSAIGRALANLGMSISKQRPSREEMQKVQRYEDERTAPTPRQMPQEPRNAPTPPALPIDMVLATLRDMDEARDPFPAIKQYAQEHLARFDPVTQERIKAKVKQIADGRRASAPAPLSVAG